ncbi:hypothetical protein HDU67_000233 [Dinochytrium kinnereticum]|nr:hypothetical protein HDU67_000233 [Dinochytrium kinnereticum]
MIRHQPRAPYALPFELWVRIFSHLDPTTPRLFTQACKWFKLIGDDPHTRCAWFITKYGRALGLLHAFRNHRLVLNAEVGKLMLAAGCGVPRFLVQWVDKEYHRPDRTRRSVSAAVFVFFVNAGFARYGADADFKEDDVARFERSIYSQNTSAPDTVDTIKSLIETFKFVPVRGFGSPIDETVYLVSKIDLKLVTGFIQNGLDISSVNDLVMERVLWRSDVSDSIIQAYLSVGFQLSAVAVKKGLQMARPAALEVLRAKVPQPLLQRLAEETVYDMFGPSIRGWNFTPEALDFLTAAFPISEEVMEHAIFRLPGAPADLPDSFPATRCYMKANPCPAWRWVLRTYGPTHKFTMACFDDALSRAAAERDLHALHDVFLEAGVQFRPRHVKILACRVLHRDMTANALHLIQVMRAQVTLSYRDLISPPSITLPTLVGPHASSSSSSNSVSHLTTPPSSPIITSSGSAGDGVTREDASGPMFIPTHAELQSWIRNLRDEITENEEWDHRMRTTQLEGGPRGGAYRISRAPEDAVKFLEEARDFVMDLSPPPPSSSSTADRKGKANGRFRGSVVIGKTSLDRTASSSSSSSPPPSPGGLNRPIAALNRRNRGIVRRNSAPVPGGPFAGGGGALTSSTTTQTAAMAAPAPSPPETPVVAEPDQGAEADDEHNDEQEDEVQQHPLGDDVEDAGQPAGPPSPSQTLGVGGRRTSRSSSQANPTSVSGRAFEGLVRRISTWWSLNIVGGAGRNGMIMSHNPWDRSSAAG